MLLDGVQPGEDAGEVAGPDFAYYEGFFAVLLDAGGVDLLDPGTGVVEAEVLDGV